jgi:hypothetical protein
MFVYQPEINNGQKVVPGVLNSATEYMTPEIWRQLLTSPQTKWLVNKHREVRKSLTPSPSPTGEGESLTPNPSPTGEGDSGEGGIERWLEDKDYQEYARCMSKGKTREAKAFADCKDDGKRVEMWCNSLKRRLPYVIFVATYPKRSVKEGAEPKMWRNQKFAQLNGLVVMDVDHVKSLTPSPSPTGEGGSLTPNPSPTGEGDFGEGSGCAVRKVWEEAYAKLSEADRERILLVYVSPGGEGLKVVLKATLEGNLIDNQILFARKLGMKVDKSCKDAARGAFLTTIDDIIYMNEKELFTYENKEFGEKYNEQYHRGNSQPTLQTNPLPLPVMEGSVTGGEKTHPLPLPIKEGSDNSGGEVSTPLPQREGMGESLLLSYNGWKGSIEELLKAYYPEKQPGPEEKGGSGMSRHTESLKWAYDLLIMTGRNKQRTEQLLRSIPWVKDIVEERGEDVEQTVKDADARVGEREKKYGAEVKVSKAMQAALKQLMEEQGLTPAEEELPLEEWGKEIEELFPVFPCLKEACQGQRVGVYPAVLFVSAAFLGTLMTRCTWHHWYEPDKVRRLNYSVIIIGPPTSGKNFATTLYEVLAAPIKVADQVGYDAMNKWKEEKSTRPDNKEKPKKPVPVIRDHPARTANGVFIGDMVNAVEVVDGEEMNLHLLTFDSELDNATLMQKGGQWIDKTAMELKAFHNEEDGQAYANPDSISGKFRVFWNFVYTGTPLSLDRKVNERNFGTGLATRLAVIPMPGRNFKLAEYGQRSVVDNFANETLKSWAFKLDGVKGELPIEPLVRETYEWQSAWMEMAAHDKDEAADMLLMRVPYYGIGVAVPFVVMRHWKEWKEKKTLTIDEYDKKLCRLAMNIQYKCQQHFFYAYAHSYFENMKRDRKEKQRTNKSDYDECYKKLPQEFKIKDIMEKYGISSIAARGTAKRLFDDGFVTRLKHGVYRKLKQTLI